MNARELVRFGEQIKEQGVNQGRTMMNLVYDPVSGDFRQVPKGEMCVVGDIVTEMTEKGFA